MGIKKTLVAFAVFVSMILAVGGIALAQDDNPIIVCTNPQDYVLDGITGRLCLIGEQKVFMPDDDGRTEPIQPGNIEVVNCPEGAKTIQWGPAGRAPQTLRETVAVLQVADSRDLTVLYLCEGNDTAIGWVLGTTHSERVEGKTQTAGFVPAGVTVDYDPGASQLRGDIAHSQDFTSMWRRSLLSGNGWAQGLKFTFYWTPAVFTDGYGATVAVDTQAIMPTEEYVPPATEPGVYQPNQNGDSAVNTCPTNGRGIAKAVVTKGRASVNIGRIPNNGWLLTSNKSFTVERPANNWILHTPKHPGDPGLRWGEETLSVVSAYCKG